MPLRTASKVAGRTDHPLYHQLPSPACLDHDLQQALGELSLNEDDQVRHHSQASGLYLLGDQERLDIFAINNPQI